MIGYLLIATTLTISAGGTSTDTNQFKVGTRSECQHQLIDFIGRRNMVSYGDRGYSVVKLAEGVTLRKEGRCTKVGV